MDIFYLVALLVLLTANCPQTNAKNNATEKNETIASEDKVLQVPTATLKLIEVVTRRILAKGITTLNVPSVEPLKLYNLSYYLKNSKFGIIRSTLNEIKIEGITNFKFLDVVIRRNNNSDNCSGELLSAYIKMSLQDIQVAVNVNGSATISVFPTVDMEGIVNMNLSLATGFINVTVCSDKLTMEMIQFDFDINFNKTDMDFSKLNIAGYNAAFMVRLARKTLAKVYDVEKGVLINKTTKHVKDVFNDRAKEGDNFKIMAEIIQLIYDSVLI